MGPILKKSRTGLKSDFPEFQSKNSSQREMERGGIKARSQEVVSGLSSDQVSVMSRPGQAVQLYTTAAAGIPEVGGTIDRLELARSAVGCHYFHLCLNLVLRFSDQIIGY